MPPHVWGRSGFCFFILAMLTGSRGGFDEGLLAVGSLLLSSS